MLTYRAYKYRLYAGRRNKHLHRQIDVAGTIWNHITALQRRYYRLTGGYIHRNRLMKHVAKLRNGCFSAWQELGSQAVQDVIVRHDKAWQRFFSRARSRSGSRVSPPRFKKVSKYASFTLKQAGWKVLSLGRIRIGRVSYRYINTRPIEGQIKTVTIKRDRLGNLYVSFLVAQEVAPGKVSTNRIGGFDFGLKTFLTDDQGNRYESRQFFRESMSEIARLQRYLARKKRGSSNRKKARRRLAKAYQRIANRRRDHHFKLAGELLSKYDVLCFEDLNLLGMTKLWGRKVNDLGFAEFLSILEQMAQRQGKQVVKIGRFEPSSQSCSACGHRQPVPLRERVFRCGSCGLELDRDVNAAKNIKSWGFNSGVGDVIRPETAVVPA